MNIKPILIAPLFMAVGSLTAIAEKAAPVKTLEIGATAPDFTLPGVDGQKHSLKDYSDAKALVLIFTCNHCPDARAARNKTIALHKDYKDKGVAVVAISGNDNTALRLA